MLIQLNLKNKTLDMSKNLELTHIPQVSQIMEPEEKLLSNPVTHDHHDKMAPPKKKMPYNPVGQVCPSHLANLTHF